MRTVRDGDGEMALKENWHLSKSVPISLIFALIVQAGAIIWTVSSMQSDIEVNRRDILVLDRQVDTLVENDQVQAVQIGRIDERLESIDKSLIKLADSFDRYFRITNEQ